MINRILYGMDYNDEKLYDVVIDTTENTAVQNFQKTLTKLQQFENIWTQIKM